MSNLLRFQQCLSSAYRRGVFKEFTTLYRRHRAAGVTELAAAERALSEAIEMKAGPVEPEPPVVITTKEGKA